MQISSRPLWALVFVAALTFLSVGCSPEASKNRHLKTADGYYDAGEYQKAEVEYLGVLKIDTQNPRAIARLGLIYSAQGRTNRAIAYIMRAHELLPDDLDVRLKVGQLYHASGKLAEARKEADTILTRNPQDKEAPLLWVATMTKPEEGDMLRKRLMDLPAPAPTSSPVLVALASLELRLNHVPEAEALLQKAKAAAPSDPAVYTVLAALQLIKKNVSDAMQSFQQAAALSPPRSPRILQYAQFKIRSGDLAGGKKILLESTAKAPDYVPAWVALAEIALMENKLPECSDFVTKALTRDPQNVEALVIQGRVHNLKGEFDKAIALFEKLAQTYPKLPVVHQELGRAYALTDEFTKAINSLTQAVALAPNAPESVLLLARLNARKGDVTGAIALLRKLTAQHPDLAPAQFMLADSYRAQGNLDGALAIYQQLEQQAPKNPQTPLLRGLVLAQQGKTAESRSAYERAFELSPDSPAALEQLINLHLKDKEYQAATARLEAEIAKNPKLAGAGHLLLAKVALARDDKGQAEVHLKKTIELNPESPTAYYLLAGIYSRTNQQDKALAQLNEILSRDPKQTTALMLRSVMMDQQGNYTAAREGYEKILADDPHSAVALNNLAYLYSERLNGLDKAFDLAQRARQLMPNDPHSADTLGWILYKKRQFTRALTLLNDAAEKRPADPEIQFHLGMTKYMMGDEIGARADLQNAVNLDPEAKWKAIAQQALALLQIDASAPSPSSRAVVEKALAEQSDDPVALSRLAMLQERDGKPEQAIKTLETATKSNPANVNIMLNLARLHGTAKHPAEALEYAKAARKLAPDDADVTRPLGNLAFENGDFQWSYSLLQEAARKQQNSPELLYDLALASYAVGRVSDAETTMRQALAPPQTPSLSPFSRTNEARQFLELVALAQNPAEAAKQSALIDQVLKADPTSVPALMASAALNEQKNATEAARQNYEKALARFPDFTPAKLRLVQMGSTQTSLDQKIYDWALQIRTAYPADPLVAKTLGIQTHLKGDHARAVSLLKQSVAARDSDAVAHFYLGLAQHQVNDPGAAKSLQRAIDLGLKDNALNEARRVIAELKK